MILVLFADLRAPLSRQALASLSERDAAHALRIPHAGERKRFVVGRHLLRRALTEAIGEERCFEVEQRGGGKPHLVHGPPHLDFSISHAEGAVAVAVSMQGRVGLDIERSVGLDPDSIASVFSARELAALAELPAAEKPRACLRAWIEKEAAGKLAGIGPKGLGETLPSPPERNRNDLKSWTLDFGSETYELCLAYEGPPQAEIRLRRETA